jgi:ferredoxin
MRVKISLSNYVETEEEEKEILSIGEEDDEIMESCRQDAKAREYYKARAKEIGKEIGHAGGRGLKKLSPASSPARSKPLQLYVCGGCGYCGYKFPPLF